MSFIQPGDAPRFAPDLYHGTAGFYDRYRLPYPGVMLDDLLQRAGVSGRGRLLDLACGTGQLAFPLRRAFTEVWAVDREPGMVDLVREKAGAIHAVAADAEALDAEPGFFELAVIGNAFHRLDRDLVAARVLGWLAPGGAVALCWSSGLWAGDEGWQQAVSAVVDRWRAALGAEHRVPAGWNASRERRPDVQVLAEAGFEVAGRQTFTVGHTWRLPEIAGYTRSMSVLPAAELGRRAAEFEAELAAALTPHGTAGGSPQLVSFAYDLARKPATGT